LSGLKKRLKEEKHRFDACAILNQGDDFNRNKTKGQDKFSAEG
jgi:hypothetical protein